MHKARNFTRYWKGSESHSAYGVPRVLFEKIRILDVSPLSARVFAEAREDDHIRLSKPTATPHNVATGHVRRG